VGFATASNKGYKRLLQKTLNIPPLLRAKKALQGTFGDFICIYSRYLLAKVV
jgi:hypothetical protein